MDSASVIWIALMFVAFIMAILVAYSMIVDLMIGILSISNKDASRLRNHYLGAITIIEKLLPILAMMLLVFVVLKISN